MIVKKQIKVTFTEPLLGSVTGNPVIYKEFIEQKTREALKSRPDDDPHKATIDARLAEEQASLPPESDDEIQKATTVFFRDETGLFLMDYQVRGSIKGNIGALVELGEATLSKWTFKREIDLACFVHPRRIQLLTPAGEPYKAAPNILERPLRATTMRGERVALARSEMLPEGTTLTFDVTVIESSNTKGFKLRWKDVENALNYGTLVGMSQWRSGGYGRFTWEAKDK